MDSDGIVAQIAGADADPILRKSFRSISTILRERLAKTFSFG